MAQATALIPKSVGLVDCGGHHIPFQFGCLSNGFRFISIQRLRTVSGCDD